MSKDNPSDLWLASALVSTSGSIGAWNPAYNIYADMANSYTPSYEFQIEPELCPDGYGGVFLLYYSAKAGEDGTIWNYSISPLAMLFESGPRGPQQMLNSPDGTATFNINDFIGMVWNPVKGYAEPVWTDGSPGTSSIYSDTIPPSPIGGTVTVPTLGDLGFSNQRRVVMTGSTAHLAGFQGPNTGGRVSTSILYSEQTSSTSGGSASATNWTTPLELNNDDFSAYTVTSGPPGTPYLSSYANGQPPSEGVYQRGGASGQKAVAVVWSEEPPGYLPGYLAGQEFIYIRVKEYDACEAGDLSDWSSVDRIGGTGASNNSESIRPVVAPLTVPVAGSPKDRYLIGWVITYADANQLKSVTYLRGARAGAEWTMGADSGVETKNENWGLAAGGNLNPGTGTNFAGAWATNSDGTFISDLVNDEGGGFRLVDDGFVSITSNESNGNGFTPPDTNNQTEEIVFTGNGTRDNSDVWDVNATYKTIAYPTLGAQGTNLGEPALNYSLSPPQQFPTYDLEVPKGRLDNVLGKYSFDRNPSVTITSTGQKIVAWEHLEGTTQAIGAPYLGGDGPPCLLPYFNYVSIRLSKTLADGSWGHILDAISASANNLSWTWLLNPSLTAFPKTPLNFVSNSTSDQDPGAAEMLFWQQNAITVTGCTWTKTTPNGIHERHFDEVTPGMPWSGIWTSGDPTDPLHLQTWGPFSGANSQRSFGIYNNGPQFHPNNLLFFDAGTTDSYVHGLSYGISNSLISGVPQPQLSSPVPDIGALKMGTFDTALGVQLYRSETRVMDSSSVTFKWGKVYVEDSSNGLPIREVMLHSGPPDSTGYASNNATRDSLFSTEWFNWPISARIKYDRLMLFPQAGTLNYNIDTSVRYDTVGDTVLVFDTVPGTFTADTTRRTDSGFIASGVSMKYTVQLIHQSGHIDTVEQLTYDPYDSLYIWPMTVTLDDAGTANDTVMLRVKGTMTGIPDADTDAGFMREQMLDTYPSWGDTTIAIGTGGGIVPPPDTCFYAMGPYENPSVPASNDVSMLVHYCGPTSTISAQVYTMLGTPVGVASTITSDGQEWDKLPINSPSLAGSFYIVVTVGLYSSTLGYTVY